MFYDVVGVGDICCWSGSVGNGVLAAVPHVLGCLALVDDFCGHGSVV